MFFIFVVFVLGWIPASTVPLLQLSEEITLWIYQFIQLRPVISPLITIVDLFLYNRDLTQYLREKIVKYLYMNRNLNK